MIEKAFIGPYTKYPAGSRPFEDFIQIGGSPAWIQDEEEYYANELLRRGYSYLLQVNEDRYLPEMIRGNYPFCFGALYLYGKLESGELSGVPEAFWQNS